METLQSPQLLPLQTTSPQGTKRVATKTGNIKVAARSDNSSRPSSSSSNMSPPQRTLTRPYSSSSAASQQTLRQSEEEENDDPLRLLPPTYQDGFYGRPMLNLFPKENPAAENEFKAKLQLGILDYFGRSTKYESFSMLLTHAGYTAENVAPVV